MDEFWVVKAIVSVVVTFVHRSNVSTKLISIKGEDIVCRHNPAPYNAPYYGKKLHGDQIEPHVRSHHWTR